MELRGWLVDTYNDDDDEEGNRGKRIKFCAACRDIVTIVSPPLRVFMEEGKGDVDCAGSTMLESRLYGSVT